MKKKLFMGLGDKRAHVGSPVDRLRPYNDLTPLDEVIEAKNVVEGLLSTWANWRTAGHNNGLVSRALAGSFIARTMDSVLRQQSTDPTAVAFVRFLGETLTTQEYAQRKQAQRLADVISGVTLPGNGTFEPFQVLDETCRTNDDQDQTTELIALTFDALGLEEELEQVQIVDARTDDNGPVNIWYRTVPLPGRERIYELVWTTHELSPEQIRHTLTLQMTPPPAQ